MRICDICLKVYEYIHVCLCVCVCVCVSVSLCSCIGGCTKEREKIRKILSYEEGRIKCNLSTLFNF